MANGDRIRRYFNVLNRRLSIPELRMVPVGFSFALIIPVLRKR
jgi:hypothetical protein